MNPPPAKHHPRQIEINLRVWKEGDNVADYALSGLRPVEALILARYGGRLSQRVLEVGCGAGRILAYLIRLGGEVHGIDVSERMLGYCSERFPQARLHLGDLREIDQLVDGPFDAILLPDNVLDVVDDRARREFLARARELLGPSGVLIFSSHNLAFSGGSDPDGLGLVRRLFETTPERMWRRAVNAPRRAANRRRLGPLAYRADDHAVLNDVDHEFGVLYYYIAREHQQLQLEQAGFELLESLDENGDPVPPAPEGRAHWLHYVATPREGAD